MKTITSKEVRIIQENGSWTEGVSQITNPMRECFESGYVSYWKEAKSYVIYDALYHRHYCVTKNFYDQNELVGRLFEYEMAPQA